MKSWQAGKDVAVWSVLSGFYNIYLVEVAGIHILVDTGRRTHRNIIDKNLKHLLKGKNNIEYLVLTHTHFDHCENAAYIHKQWGCKVIVSSKESRFLQDGSTPLPRGANIFTYILSYMGNRFARDKFSYEALTPEIEIKSTFKFDEFTPDILIVATPGHSIGSISLIINNYLAIVGDSLFGASGNTIFPPFADDKKELLRTWQKLLEKTDCITFLPGHGKPINRELLKQELRKKCN